MDISLINAGRGAGKTYNLVQWAKESPHRYVVGRHFGAGDQMREAGLERQFVHYNRVETLRGRQGIEVAFDDFGHIIDTYLYDKLGLARAKSVILATTLAVSDLQPEVKLVPVTGPYAEAIKEKYGNIPESPLTKEDLEKLTADPNVVVASGGWCAPKEQAYDPLDLCAESEPDTKEVRADQLRLRDKIVGKGRVSSIELMQGKYPSGDRVVVTVKSAGFEGTLKVSASEEIEVEN